ncbi:MAG: hypothetical protein ABIJ37_05145 [Pseudomonadota bacterium]
MNKVIDYNPVREGEELLAKADKKNSVLGRALKKEGEHLITQGERLVEKSEEISNKKFSDASRFLKEEGQKLINTGKKLSQKEEESFKQAGGKVNEVGEILKRKAEEKGLKK